MLRHTLLLGLAVLVLAGCGGGAPGGSAGASNSGKPGDGKASSNASDTKSSDAKASGRKPKSTRFEHALAPPAANAEVLKFTVAELSKNLQADDPKQYEGKWIEFEGYVVEIHLLGPPYWPTILLRETPTGGSVARVFPARHNPWTKFSAGSKVRVKANIGGNVLWNGELTLLEGEPTREFTVEELLAEFKLNGAKSAWNEREVLIRSRPPKQVRWVDVYPKGGKQLNPKASHPENAFETADGERLWLAMWGEIDEAPWAPTAAGEVLALGIIRYELDDGPPHVVLRPVSPAHLVQP